MLHLTIWCALACFAAAESGKRRVRLGRAVRWIGPVSAAGIALLVAHIGLAFHMRYGWSHDAAVVETARQTASTFGLNWGGRVWINYLFALVWAVDAWHWLVRPTRAAARPRALEWALRAFYLTIVFNGAVVFVTGARRALGVLLTLWIAWAWRPIRSR